MAEQTISGNVKTAYNEFYQKHDEAWRKIQGALYFSFAGPGDH